MDPFEDEGNSGEWWKDAELPNFSSEEEDPPSKPLPHVILPSVDACPPQVELPRLPDLAVSSSPSTATSSRGKTKHLKISAKELHLRWKGKSQQAEDAREPSAMSMHELVEEMFPYPSSPSYSQVDSEPDSVASTARSFGLSSTSDGSSSHPCSWLFKSVKERDDCINSIATCLEQGDLDKCSINEKRRILDELKMRLKTIEGGVDSLKTSLKRIIKYKLCAGKCSTKK